MFLAKDVYEGRESVRPESGKFASHRKLKGDLMSFLIKTKNLHGRIYWRSKHLGLSAENTDPPRYAVAISRV